MARKRERESDGVYNMYLYLKSEEKNMLLKLALGNYFKAKTVQFQCWVQNNIFINWI